MKTALVLALVGAPVAYLAVPRIVSSGWARSKVERALSRTTGAEVRVGSLSMTWKQGFTATDVKADPVVRGRITVTPSIREVRFAPRARSLCASTTKASLTLVEPSVEIKQTLDEAPAGPACAPRRCSARGIRLDALIIENGRVSFDSEGFNQPVVIEKLNVRAELQARQDRLNVVVHELTCRLNDGTLTASGTLAIDAGAAESRVALEARDVTANDLLARALKVLVPIFETAAPGGEVRGKLDLKFEAEGKGDTISSMFRAATGRGQLAFNGRVAGTRLMDAIGRHVGDSALPELAFDGVSAPLQLAEGRVHNMNSLLTTPWGNVVVSGSATRSEVDLLVRLDPRLISGREGRAEEALRKLLETGGIKVGGTLQQPVCVE
jgi:uncharacterized protein YhdP